jgi:ASC-1-like (ASCH) protein
MNIWHTLITNEIMPLVKGDHFWEDYLCQSIADGMSSVGIHLAIFVEPYLSYILNGKKTVESRFGVQRRAPYGQVAKGDIIFLKRSGGPIMGLCKVSSVWFYKLNPQTWKKLRTEYTTSLCAQDPQFWEQRANASFATLMQIVSVKKIQPVHFPKNDRRGWVVFRPPLRADRLYL